MRASPGLILALLAAVVSLPAALAADTQSASAHFLVSAHATVVKTWTYSTSATVAGCRSRVSGSGSRTISFRSSDLSPVSVSWAGGDVRARFAGAIPIVGTLIQTGTKTTRVSGASSCDAGTHRVTCRRLRSSISGREVRVVSRRAHRMSLTPLRGVVPAAFYGDCPGEPRPIRRMSNGLEIADTRYSEPDLLSGSTGGFGVEGGADVTTRLFSPPGKVVQRIRWTLLFRRVGG